MTAGYIIVEVKSQIPKDENVSSIIDPGPEGAKDGSGATQGRPQSWTAAVTS